MYNQDALYTRMTSNTLVLEDMILKTTTLLELSGIWYQGQGEACMNTSVKVSSSSGRILLVELILRSWKSPCLVLVLDA